MKEATISRCGCKSVCSCLITAGDNPCIDTEVSGSGALDNPYIVTAAPIISTDVNNTLECRANGLFASGAAIIGDIDGDGCVDTSVVEGPDNVFTLEATLVVQPDSADPNGGPNPGNGLECTPTGALVAPSTEAGNAIRYGTDGRLYVSPTAVDVDTILTDCLDLQISGTGTPGDPFVISGTPIIADDQPNALSCTPDGLLVTPTNAAVIDNAQNIDVVEGPDNTFTFTCVPVPIAATTAQPGPGCLGITGDTCNGFTVTLGISDDPNQALVCRPDGLFVCEVESATGAAGTALGPSGPFNGTQLYPNRFIQTGNACVVLANPSDCRAMAVRFLVQEALGEGLVDGGKMEAGIEFSLDGGATFNQSGSVVGPFDNGANNGGSYFNGDTGLFVTVPPGGVLNACVRGFVNGVNTVNGRFTSLSINLNLDGRAA